MRHGIGGVIGVLAACVLTAGAALGAEWYVSPDGKPDGAGTKAQPWDLRTAWTQPAAVKPGDTIWMLGGTHRLMGGTLFTKLTGTKDARITVRGAPGQRVTIDLARADGSGVSSLYLCGAWTDYRDMEFMSSRGGGGSWQQGSADPGTGEGTRIINVVLHDIFNIGSWRGAYNSEMYGCLIYFNGRRNHGHGIYVQNTFGTKNLRDNILFGEASRGIAPHGSMGVTGLNIEGNVSFSNGAISQGGPYENLYLWTQYGSGHDWVVGNYTYHPLKGGEFVGVRETASDTIGDDVTIRDNYFVGGGSALLVQNWQWAAVTGNRIVGPNVLGDLSLPKGVKYSYYTWNHNTYYETGKTEQPFRVAATTTLSLADWQKQTGFDSDSRVITGRPTGVDTFVRPNKYEAGRATIIIYNWDLKPSVDVALDKAGLANGQKYEVRDVQNYYGDPLLKGTYDGKPITIPMTGLKIAMPLGQPSNFVAPVHTAPEFGVFVVLPEATGGN